MNDTNIQTASYNLSNNKTDTSKNTIDLDHHMPPRMQKIHFHRKSSIDNFRTATSPLSLQWTSVSKSIVLSGNIEKVILDSVSGSASPGEVLALMGPSGSGKTSLLDILANRSSFQPGKLYLNGNPLTSENAVLKKWLKRKIAYVRQKDVFFDHLTVRDQLMYTALLRLTCSREEKEEEVEHVVQLLKLKKCADTEIKLLSGGERKRTNIGTELLTDPSIILLDEPTSGLDSNSCVALMKLLKNLAATGNKTVICSIHQPTSSVFARFDKVLFLCEGNEVYFGTPSDSLVYLQNIKAPCPEGYNIADRWMDLLTMGDELTSSLLTPSNTEEENITTEVEEDTENTDSVTFGTFHGTKEHLIQLWKKAKPSQQVENSTSNGRRKSMHCELVTDDQKYNTSWWTQFLVLLNRSMKNSRSEIFTVLNIVKSFFLGLLVGIMWFRVPYTEGRVKDISAYFFFSMSFWVIDNMYGALFAFPMEREVLFKERNSGMYRLSAYFMAKTFAEAPTRLVLPFIYILVSYWSSEIRNNVLIFLSIAGCSLLSVLAGESIGLCIGAMVMDMEKGIVVVVIFSLALLIPGGFFLQNIPSFLIWTKYISPFKYLFDGSLIIMFDRSVPCDGSGVIPECSLDPVGYVSPDEVLDYLGVQDSLLFNISMLIVIIISARLGAYFFLRAKKGEERL